MRVALAAIWAYIALVTFVFFVGYFPKEESQKSYFKSTSSSIKEELIADSSYSVELEDSLHVKQDYCLKCEGSGECSHCYGQKWQLHIEEELTQLSNSLAPNSFGLKYCNFCGGHGLCSNCLGTGKKTIKED